MIALFVSSHYKNSPDDLLLMSDAPAHHLFVLLGPVDEKQNTLPEIICAVQVCLEGQISQKTVINSLAEGKNSAGDLIPWNLSQQFQDSDFPSLSGARVVRIATNPEYQKMGYGSRALELLAQYYQGDITSLSEEDTESITESDTIVTEDASLLTEEIKPKKNLPPLLLPLKDRKSERLHWIGVSFGLTQQLFSFWKRAGYIPVYVRQTLNEITGEHTCLMLKSLKTDDLEVTCDPEWLAHYSQDFQKRFISLLGFMFRKLPCSLALSILNPKKGEELSTVLQKEDLEKQFSPYDLKRLASYSNNLLDYHVVLDLVPSIAKLHFMNLLPISLSAGQSAILLALGLQHKSVEDIANEMPLQVQQILALFSKAIRKIVQYLRGIQEKAVAQQLPAPQKVKEVAMRPDQRLDADLEESATLVEQDIAREREELLNDPELTKFAIRGASDAWNTALKKGSQVPSIVSIQSPSTPQQHTKRKGQPFKDKHKTKSFKRM